MKTSVALCTYNGGRHLHQQLESIFQQTVPVHQIIISDDGSTDDTITVIKSFQQLYPGIVQLHQNETNLGAKKNFEKAISLCSGDVIFLSDQDDLWLPHKVAATLLFFQQHPQAAAVFSNGSLMDEQGNSLGYTIWQSMGFSQKLQETVEPQQLFELLVRINNIVTGAALCIKKEACSYLLPFFCPDRFWHDYWIALAAAAKNQLYFIQDELIRYRMHEGQQAGLPLLNAHFKKQNEIKEMHCLQQYNSAYAERFLYYNIGSRTRFHLFAPRIGPLVTGQNRLHALQTLLDDELEILKKHLFAGMGFIEKKKLAIIHLLGRQKSLNMTPADVIKLIFS